MSDTAIWPAHVVERNGLRIVIHTQPAVNLALIHNRVPLITEIAVTNELNSPWGRLFPRSASPQTWSLGNSLPHYRLDNGGLGVTLL
jgi:hypothetical protein